MNELELGIWLSGLVSGLGLAVVVWTVVYLAVDMVRERRER